MKIDGLAAFIAIVDAGSISAAARQQGLAKSVISERLSELERLLNARLLQRTTRKLSLTEDGEKFLIRARRVLHEIKEARAEIAERRGSLSGGLRISAPLSFGLLHLGPAINRFLREHPEIELTLDLQDRFVDAAADGFDAVIRHGYIADTRLVAKRLSTSRRLLLASPEYLARNGIPSSIDELSQHTAILYAGRESDWRFAKASGWTVVRSRAKLRVNNGIMMRDAAVAGLGMTLLPSFFVNAELRSGSLVAIDVGAEAEGAELHIVYPRERSTSAKLVALTEFLRESFGNPPYWDR